MSTCCTPRYTCQSPQASSALLKPCSLPLPIYIPPHPSPLWMTLILDRVLQRGCPPISDSILHPPPPHSFLPQASNPRPVPYVCQQLQRRCAPLMSNCHPSLSPSLSPLLSLSLLSGPGRLGYALITLRIIPSLPAATQQSSDSAGGIMGAPEEQWVSKHRAPEQPIMGESKKKGLVRFPVLEQRGEGTHAAHVHTRARTHTHERHKRTLGE